nr:immunoglobulin light chain junction region [Macaca mulatta]MPO08015.1 immunoglobulin light chain junction region [Macaca mulatta]MPO08492.1 immunoglobulin light chain junction region [Macaca mulatta]MPO13552.1 immunoglobulin light chain junction region [Macaca mulatta]MPO14289.1 immunoglobulin light chain junction region [Macaca mulatta]
CSAWDGSLTTHLF